MKTVKLEDVTTTALRESEQLLVDLVRTKYPHLDLRIGTALRDLLVVPDSAIHAWFEAQAEEQREVSSLRSLLERANNGEEVDTEDVLRVLSNFNLSGLVGSYARGVVRVVVSSAKTYIVAAGTEFETLDGVVFSSDSLVTAVESPSAGEVKLYRGSSNWYFFVPVTCTTVGTSGNIQSGTVLGVSSAFSSFVTATAHGDFSGGMEVENLSSLVARIPAALSVRGLTNVTAVESSLRDRFDTTNDKISAVSVVGYGNPAQLRDKHNPFGIGVGGRVDVYVRNFTRPHVIMLTKQCTYDTESGTYRCHVAASEAPGMQGVYYVGDADSSALASYSHSVTYSADGTDSTWHDFDVSGGATELAGTVWRSCDIEIHDVKKDGDTKNFGIGVMCLPSATAMQNYVDDASVRNVGADYVVRCPAICRVSVNASCRYKYGTVFDVDSAKKAIEDYVNTTGFIGRLTRSEIACVLKAEGATSVDISDDYMLTGYVVDAAGTTHKLFGDALDISTIAKPSAMLTPDTCVFTTASENITLTAIPE